MTLCSRRNVAILVFLTVMAVHPAAPAAQTGERFEDRLSRLPVDRVTTSTISGQGKVGATLDGHELTLSATFEGVSSPATAAHIHRAPRARPGPPVFTLEAPTTTAGVIKDTITLTDAQRDELRNGRYYLQIHTADNPGGELRGWLLPQ